MKNENGMTLTRAEILQNHKESLTRHEASMVFLSSIREETGLNAEAMKAAREELKEISEATAEEGLTSEINTSRNLVRLDDTIQGFHEVLSRHPHGFKGDGTRDHNGQLKGKFIPFTEEENEAGQKWAASPKQGKEWALTGKLESDCWKGE
jgi:hypothetical protein